MSEYHEVELLDDRFIYVEKIGDQTEASMTELYQKVQQFAAELRKQGKPVLILSNSENEGDMDEAARKVASTIGKKLDFDKSATYATSESLHSFREIMIRVDKLQQKVANFDTKEEAVAWLVT